MGDVETMGGLQAKLEGAPAAMAAFSELEGDSAMESRVEILPTGTLESESIVGS